MNVIKKFEAFYTDLASMRVESLADIYSEDVEFIDPIASHLGIKTVERYFSKLLQNAKHCNFTIYGIQKVDVLHPLLGNYNAEQDNTAELFDKCASFVVNWQMRFTSSSINKGNPITVDGITQLKVSENKIVYHRDYYDLGQMVYEHVPLLGRIIKRIKRTLG